MLGLPKCQGGKEIHYGDLKSLHIQELQNRCKHPLQLSLPLIENFLGKPNQYINRSTKELLSAWEMSALSGSDFSPRDFGGKRVSSEHKDQLLNFREIIFPKIPACNGNSHLIGNWAQPSTDLFLLDFPSLPRLSFGYLYAKNKMLGWLFAPPDLPTLDHNPPREIINQDSTLRETWRINYPTQRNAGQSNFSHRLYFSQWVSISHKASQVKRRKITTHEGDLDEVEKGCLGSSHQQAEAGERAFF